MKVLKLSDSTIHYDRLKHTSKKSKGTIVFLHGLGLDQTTWKYILPYFSASDRLTYDLRWHGYSDGVYYSNEEENWQALINDFMKLIEHEKIEEFHLVSHGIGVQMGVELISRGFITPQTFTILSTPCYYPTNVVKPAIKYRKDMMKQLSGTEFGEWMIPQIIRNQDPAKHEVIKCAYEKARLDIYMDLLLLNANALSEEKLVKIKTPTLLLNAEFDVNFPPSLTMLSAKYFSNHQVHLISNSNNMVQVDEPEQTANRIKDFIREKLAQSSGKVNMDLPYLRLLYKEIRGTAKLQIRIDFLSIFRMTVNGIEIQGKWNQRKAKELIAFLGFYGKSPKEKVYEKLWPNSNKANVQNAFRVSLNHLRSLLKANGMEDLIYTDSQYIWLNPNYEIICDVREGLEGKRELPSEATLFADMPVDWVLELQYELEKQI
ncbi:alpha/beta fold hydrolase [Caldibacillus lycopersici]|uniref:Alpha/beta fold hydrolase n=1 Tax=Perspicuibacillus lycopersici TaxID=1325689 RepID=A0AAE3IUE6_9BACI|nr:alpha/beta hydrolase [Perspicuibacillus lycopersici]MCU9613019.1 alpha/beta fold hydrolase [Perspicuibacillus lycopersici]